MQFDHVKRREFIALFSAAAAWPVIARAQRPDRMRRIAVLMNVSESDADGQTRLVAFTHRIRELGWTDGDNVHVDIRWTGGNAERTRRYAAELVALAPDVFLAFTSPIVLALQQATHSVPIVFAGVVDPVGSGLVASMARPGGSTTGFALFEYAIAAKWLDLLKEMAPHVTRVAVLRDATIAAGIGQFAAIQAVGPIGMELSVIGLEDAGAVERAVADFAHGANGGLVVTASPFGANHPDLIPKLAARYKLPTVYPFHYFAAAGGLISYGPEFVEQSVQAADYIDRILKGEKPENLPVQAPTKYQLTVNLKAAKIIGLEMPQTLLNRADEVIE